MKRRGTTGKDRAPAGSKPPKAPGTDLRQKRNSALNEQTRKVLRRHYAARYRVRWDTTYAARYRVRWDTTMMRSYSATIRVNGHGMAVHGAAPTGPGRSPALVVVMHAAGVDTFVHAIVERLANAGYAAAAPDLYHRQTEAGTPLARKARLLDPEVITDVNAAIDYLRAQPDVDPARIGILGFCMGGRVAWLMAAANPDLRAAVSYYGGDIMVPWGPNEPSPYDRTIEIGCPILFHFGEDDKNPSPADRARLEQTLTEHGKAHEFHNYPGAGHAFMSFTNAERYRAAAAEASWPRTLEFLSRHLRA